MCRLCFTSTPEFAASLHRETTFQRGYLARVANYHTRQYPRVRKATKSGREQHCFHAQAAAQSHPWNYYLGYPKFAVEEARGNINEQAIHSTDTRGAFKIAKR
jgi:hypothetical protein